MPNDLPPPLQSLPAPGDMSCLAGGYQIGHHPLNRFVNTPEVRAGLFTRDCIMTQGTKVQKGLALTAQVHLSKPRSPMSIPLRQLFKRPASSVHPEYIGNAHPTNSPLGTAIKQVYIHQVAVYPKESINKPISNPTTRLARYFYQNCFVPPEIRRGVNGNGYGISLSTYINDVLLREPAERRNSLSYLIGDVGIGKTAFLNYLISFYGHELFAKKWWFVRIDIETASLTGILEPHLLHEKLAHKALRILSEFPEIYRVKPSDAIDPAINARVAELRATLVRSDGDSAKATQNATSIAKGLSDLAQTIRERTGRRLLLLFDNIDFVAHEHDSVMFTTEGKQIHEANIRELRRFVGSFFHESEQLNRLGAGVLFVMRSDTYSAIESLFQTSRPEVSTQNDEDVYCLIAPSWELVLNGRTKLLRHAVQPDLDKPRDSGAEQFISGIEREILSIPVGADQRLLDQIRELHNHGLREVMKFFVRLSWLGGTGLSGPLPHIGTYGGSQSLAMLLFLLNGHRLFSQSRCNFPNVYLPQTSTTDPRPSYWLKRLILEYIYQKDARQQVVIPDEILRLFSGPGRYARDTVSTCLGEMANSNNSNLIRPFRDHRKAVIDPDEIRITPRGRFFARSLVDKFVYLQLIVDDDEFRVPHELADKFRYPKPEDDYSYLILSDAFAFRRGVQKMIRKKVDVTMTLLDLLSAGLSYEVEMYQDVFNILSQERIKIPECKFIKSLLLNEFERIVRRLGLDGEEESWFGRIVSSTESRVREFQEILEPYYGFRLK